MLVPCTVESVRVHVLTGQHVVLLQAKETIASSDLDRRGSGAQHRDAHRRHRERTAAHHDLMMDVLTKLGVEITRIVVKDLVADDNGGGVFHGSLFLQLGEREVEIDCRPSDAIALAVRCEARILVSDTVLDRSAISAESEDDDNIAVFKEFIQSLPDDPPGQGSS
jgi:bifunctional DNase/RNase